MIVNNYVTDWFYMIKYDFMHLNYLLFIHKNISIKD